MSPKHVEELHEDLEKRLEEFLEKQEKDPKAREMLVYLEGD